MGNRSNINFVWLRKQGVVDVINAYSHWGGIPVQLATLERVRERLSEDSIRPDDPVFGIGSLVTETILASGGNTSGIGFGMHSTRVASLDEACAVQLDNQHRILTFVYDEVTPDTYVFYEELGRFEMSVDGLEPLITQLREGMGTRRFAPALWPQLRPDGIDYPLWPRE